MKTRKTFHRIAAYALAASLAIGVLAAPVYADSEEYKHRDPNPKETVNHALRAPYTIGSLVPMDSAILASERSAYPDTGGQELTDGYYAQITPEPEPWKDSGWMMLGRNPIGREIIVDLGATRTISELRVNAFQAVSGGVYFPRWVRFYVSDDKKRWEQAGQVDNQKPDYDWTPQTQNYSAETYVNARYVKAVVPSEIGVFLDEIEAIGPKEVDEKAKHPRGNDKDPKLPNLGYPSLTQAGGIHNLVVTAVNMKEEWGRFDKESWKPYLAYIDPQGTVKDWMFDGYMIHNVKWNGQTKEEWSSGIDELFDAGYNFAAMEEAMEEIKSELGNHGEKAKIVLSLPYPSTETANFGDVDGNGSLNFNYKLAGEQTALANRMKAIRWWIDTFMAKWNSANYKNLELKGFYWNPEEIIGHSPSEKDLMKQTGDYVHQLDLKYYNIPFFLSRGFDLSKELGFDATYMQPNYHFDPAAASDRFDITAMYAKMYGMSMQFEAEYQLIGTPNSGRLRYYAYFNAAVRHGLADPQIPKAWYLGAKVLLQAYHSGSKSIRDAYEHTYHFVKGTYKPEDTANIPPYTEGESFEHPIPVDVSSGEAVIQDSAAGSEHKFYSIEAKAGDSFAVELVSEAGYSHGLATYSGPSTDNLSGYSYNVTQPDRLVLKAKTDRRLYIRVTGDADVNPAAGRFSLRIAKPVEDGTAMERALPLESGQSVIGSLAEGESRWYKWLSVKNELTRFELVPGGSGENMDLERWDYAERGYPMNASANSAGQSDSFELRPILDEGYIYVKVIGKTAGTFRLTGAAVGPVVGDRWENPIQLEEKEGEVYNSQVHAGGELWLKFPIQAQTDWNVTLTPVNGAAVGMEARYWAPAQTPHGGFSYFGNEVQSLSVSNKESTEQAIMLRVFANDGGGAFKLSLSQSLEDGSSKMNAKPLLQGIPINAQMEAGQQYWYAVSGNSVYDIQLTPQGEADMDVELYWGSNYTNVLASSSNGAGQTENLAYANPYDPKFVYFVKAKAITAGSYSLALR